MSEWRAGDDSEAEDDLELLASPPPSAARKRLTKVEAQRMDDEAEYDAEPKARKPKAGEGGGSSGKKRGTGGSGSDHDGGTVYERVQDWIASKESTLGVVRPPQTGVDLSAGSGLTPDLTTQPWFISGATLHPHQMTALNWIKARWELGVSCVLADEMGLGKTLCAISIMAYLMERAQKEPPAPQLVPMANGNGKGTAGGSPTKAKRDAKSRLAAATAASASAPPTAPSNTGGRVGPFLVLCPLTVLDNWQTELASFAPSLIVQVFSGSKPEREELATEIGAEIRRLNPDKGSRKDPRHLPFHVLLTTYECVISDAHFLSRFRWRAAIIDEAHRLKNADSVLSSTLLSDFHLDWKLALTGTPVQNNMSELWAMLYFLAPRLFDDKKAFVEEFDILAPGAAGMTKGRLAQIAALSPEAKLSAQTTAMESLHAIIRPFMLRRLKSDIEGLDIPPKREVILRTALTKLQKDIYRNLLLKNHELIGAGAGAGAGSKAPNARALVNIVASLRKCCAHPYLFQGVEPEPFEEGDHLWQASGKFRVLRGLLRVLKSMHKRVLLFSTSVASLDVVQDLLGFLGYTYERLDGSVRGEERYEAIAKFKGKGAAGAGAKGSKADEETFVFLLSTRAGGVGLNLVCADTVIFLDSDWNPTVDAQAQARAHRIGQRKEVLVIRLLAANTLEEIILKRTQRKMIMTHNILEKGRFNQATTGVAAEGEEAAAADEDAIGRSAADLQNILQYGLDSLFGDKADAAAGASSSSASAAESELTEAEIEAIVTGTIDAAQKEASAALAAATSMNEEKDEHKAAPAPAAAASSAATPDKRPAFQRISTRVLPSLESASLEPAEPEADSSLYIYEGTDYKALGATAAAAAAARDREGIMSVEEELSASAAAGHKALQRLVAEARASGAMDAEDSGAAGADDRYASPNADRKRKAATQETDAERAVRIVKQRESAQKRADAAQRKKDEAEAARLATLAALWADNHYESTSVVIDPKWEAQFAGLASGGAAAAAVAAVAVDAQDGAAEWMGGGGDDDEEHKASSAASSARSKAQLHYVIGDVSLPFVFEREDGQAGKTSQPSQPTSLEEAAEMEISSSFDECAAAAAVGDESAAASSSAAAAGRASAASHSPSSALLLVPVDASGNWGKGGLFRALDARSSLVGAQYEMIGSMHDLHQGDVHIVSIPADQVRSPAPAPGELPAPPSALHVALCVVLKRAKGQSYGAPSIQPENLSSAFRKLSYHCSHHAFSLHLPRLAQNDPNIGWYGVERQLQKQVVARGVDTYVYYFKRRRPQYRSPVKTQLSLTRAPSSFSQMSRQDSDVSREARAISMAASASSASVPAADEGSSSAQPMVLEVDGESGTAAAASAAAASSADPDDADGAPGPLQSQLSSLTHFTDIFSSQLIYLHRGGDAGSSASMSDADVRLLTRFLSAYDGEVSDTITPRVTHIVTAEPFLTPRLLDLKKRASQRVRVVPIAWVEQCVMAGQLDQSNKMQIGLPKQ